MAAGGHLGNGTDVGFMVISVLDVNYNDLIMSGIYINLCVDTTYVLYMQYYRH